MKKEQKKLYRLETFFVFYFFLVLGITAVVGTMTVLKLCLPEPVSMEPELSLCVVVLLLLALVFVFMHRIDRLAAVVEAINAMEEEEKRQKEMLKKEMYSKYRAERTFAKCKLYSEEFRK